jgi:hypothetical protein
MQHFLYQTLKKSRKMDASTGYLSAPLIMGQHFFGGTVLVAVGSPSLCVVIAVVLCRVFPPFRGLYVNELHMQRA